MRHVESGMRDCVNHGTNSWEQNPNSPEECVIAWRAELVGILNILNVRRCWLMTAVVHFLNHPRGARGGSALGSNGAHEHVHSPFDLGSDSVPGLILVRCWFVVFVSRSILILCST